MSPIGPQFTASGRWGDSKRADSEEGGVEEGDEVNLTDPDRPTCEQRAIYRGYALPFADTSGAARRGLENLLHLLRTVENTATSDQAIAVACRVPAGLVNDLRKTIEKAANKEKAKE